MTGQPGLFDAPATRGATRSSDPQSSRDAGRSMHGHILRDQQALVLTAVCDIHRRGLRGANAYEVVSLLSCSNPRQCPQQSVASKRLGELVDVGMVAALGHRPGATGRQQITYAPTPAAIEWAVNR